MPNKEYPYDENKIEKIKTMLELFANRNQPHPYEIFVDKFKVVSKTTDIDSFDDYINYVDKDTEEVKIKIYDTAHSPRNDQHTFKVERQHHKQAAGLSGIEQVEQIVGVKLAEKDREYEARRNAELLEAIQEQLDDAEEYIEALEEKLNIAKSDRYKIKGIDLVEFASVLLGKFAEKNPAVLQGLGLGGIINTPKPELPDAPPVAASFQSKNEPAPADAREKQYLDTLRQLDSHFNEQQMVGVIGILNHLMQYPEKIDTVTALLT
jgi:hypothetical protein